MRISDAEWRVMHVLWNHSPRSARQVLEEVAAETDWAYTTVKTVLARLAEKGAVTAKLESNTSLYSPVITRDEARRTALQGLLDRAFDGTFGSLIHHLAEGGKLSPRDRRALEDAISETASPRKSTTPKKPGRKGGSRS